MRILKEDKVEGGFNPFKDLAIGKVIDDSTTDSKKDLDEALFTEEVDNPFNIKGPELN